MVGAPNSGKTTLYNWLTNSKFKTVNYPGATVEYSLGHLALHWQNSASGDFMVVDTPGIYSLQPKSLDEVVTLKVLYDNPSVGKIDGVVVVVDGTQLARHLLLAEQIKETGFPMVLAVTMSDLLTKQKIEIDQAFLAQRFGCEVVLVDGLLGGGVQELIQRMDKFSLESVGSPPQNWTISQQEEKMQEMEAVAKKALRNDPGLQEKFKKLSRVTRQVDRVLMHPVGGFLIFVLIMTGLFSSIFWAAAPFMDFIDENFGALAEVVTGWGQGNLWADFVGDGLIAGVGAVLVFVPQIFILFVGISILESSGYLARAATIIDKPFSKLGLSGRSFVPVLSGFACAVPAMIATRNIPSGRGRWITNFVIPLMSCSARLPVYALLLAFIFIDEPAWKPGLAMAAIYVAAVIVGAVAAGIVHRFLPKTSDTFFMMELPLYRRPRFKVILHQAVSRTFSYIRRAGPVILVLSVMIWVGSTFPHHQAENKLEQSYLGQLGKVMEPVFTPMGADWRVGIGLISAFAAREVFVSSMAIVFHASAEDEKTSGEQGLAGPESEVFESEVLEEESLLAHLQTARNAQGELLFTLPSVLALIVFFMIALQCMSTVAIAWKESHSWKYAVGQLVVFNLVAYALAVAVYQGLS